MGHLVRYKDQLSIDQLITAKNKILLNAQNLVNESQLLYDNKKYARSFFLASIACEELGKCIMVLSSIVKLANNSLEWKHFWKRLRNHQDKSLVIQHMENISVSDEENFSEPQSINEIAPDQEEYKMAMLYSDMFQNDFFEPNEIADEEMTKSLLFLA